MSNDPPFLSPSARGLAVGIIAGASLSIAVASGVALYRWRSIGGQPVAATSALTAEQRELAEAEQELWEGNAERAIELLVMLLPRLDQPSDRARAHDDLGQAEMARGHARLATAYFQQAFDLAPNAERLYWLALSNDKGGALERALPLYRDLARWPTQDADPYRKIAQDRIPRILTLLGTPNPTSPPK